MSGQPWARAQAFLHREASLQGPLPTISGKRVLSPHSSTCWGRKVKKWAWDLVLMTFHSGNLQPDPSRPRGGIYFLHSWQSLLWELDRTYWCDWCSGLQKKCRLHTPLGGSRLETLGPPRRLCSHLRGAGLCLPFSCCTESKGHFLKRDGVNAHHSMSSFVT